MAPFDLECIYIGIALYMSMSYVKQNAQRFKYSHPYGFHVAEVSVLINHDMHGNHVNNYISHYKVYKYCYERLERP